MNLFTDQTKNYRIVVTGGAGFIGSQLINKLLENKNLYIFNLDKLNYASDLNRINISSKEKRYKFLKIDLYDEKSVKESISSIDPDFIIHLAAESHVDRSIKNPKVFIESNIFGTYNLLEATRLHWNKIGNERKKYFKFLHISTDEVFGSLGKDGFFSEKTAYDPRSPYSSSKASSDHLVKAWHHTYGLPVVITNCSNNYGPWQFPEKLIPLTIMKAIKKQVIPLYGDGLNIRDWIYIDDHIDGLLKVLEKGKEGKSYCIGGNGEITNLELVKKICKIIDNLRPYKEPYESFINLVKDRPGHDRRYSIDSSFIKKELGWQPKFNLDNGLLITTEWYLNNFEWCKKISSRKI